MALEGKPISGEPEPLLADDLVKKHEMYRKILEDNNSILEDFDMEVCNMVFDMEEFELVGAITKVFGIRQEVIKYLYSFLFFCCF